MSPRTSAFIFEVERSERGYLIIKPHEGELSAWVETREDSGGIERSYLVVPLDLRTGIMPDEEGEEGLGGIA